MTPPGGRSRANTMETFGGVFLHTKGKRLMDKAAVRQFFEDLMLADFKSLDAQ